MNFQNSPQQSKSQSGRGGSYGAVSFSVEVQLEAADFPEEMQSLVECVVRIITDVMALRPSDEITIDGHKYRAEDVQEVYSHLTHEMVEDVLDRFCRVGYEIRHIKTYLRTSLYNAVLEHELIIENMYRKDHAL